MKQKERHERRQRQLATINEDKFLSVSHLRALEEQLQLKMYLNNDDNNDIVDELQEERERLRTRLALCQATWQQRPSQAQRTKVMEKINAITSSDIGSQSTLEAGLTDGSRAPRVPTDVSLDDIIRNGWQDLSDDASPSIAMISNYRFN